MSRITDIRDSILTSEGNLENALLSCLVLAEKLGYEPLRVWANFELRGYPDLEIFPEYRKGKSRLRGTFFQGNRYQTHYYVPEYLIDESIREQVTGLYVFDPFNKLLNITDDGSLNQFLQGLGSVVSLINVTIEQKIGGGGMVYFDSINLPVLPGFNAGVLGGIRLRLIELMIELNRIFPNEESIMEVEPIQLGLVDEAFRRNVEV